MKILKMKTVLLVAGIFLSLSPLANASFPVDTCEFYSGGPGSTTEKTDADCRADCQGVINYMDENFVGRENSICKVGGTLRGWQVHKLPAGLGSEQWSCQCSGSWQHKSN